MYVDRRTLRSRSKEVTLVSFFHHLQREGEFRSVGARHNDRSLSRREGGLTPAKQRRAYRKVSLTERLARWFGGASLKRSSPTQATNKHQPFCHLGFSTLSKERPLLLQSCYLGRIVFRCIRKDGSNAPHTNQDCSYCTTIQ